MPKPPAQSTLLGTSTRPRSRVPAISFLGLVGLLVGGGYVGYQHYFTKGHGPIAETDEKVPSPESPKPAAADKVPSQWVETLVPLASGKSSSRMGIVWLDPERPKETERVRLSDSVRYEDPRAKQEVAWSSAAGQGGLDVLLDPRPDLVLRVYRLDAKDRHRVVSEVPILNDADKPFWRNRDKSMLRVPLFFVAEPSVPAKTVDFDADHTGMSVSKLASPYDWGVVLSSNRALVLMRARVAWQKDWLAVDLSVYNILGPALDAPPDVFVRLSGGEQPGKLTVEHADKLIPGDFTFAEFEHEISGHDVDASARVILPRFGIGVTGAYSYRFSSEKGKSKAYTQIHPSRRDLFSRDWKASRLAEGSFRRGLVLFAPPQGESLARDASATLVLTTPFHEEFAYLEFKGVPPVDSEVTIPGSVVERLKYRHSR